MEGDRLIEFGNIPTVCRRTSRLRNRDRKSSRVIFNLASRDYNIDVYSGRIFVDDKPVKSAEWRGMTETATRRGRPTAEDARQKQENILAVAREMFSDLGYRAVTMRDVADRARVSTRTLYNRYADKVSLFSACINFHATVFPQLELQTGQDLEGTLGHYAAEIVRALSEGAALRIGTLVFREGSEVPELVQAADANQNRYLIQPLAKFLRGCGLEKPGSVAMARLFIAMALAEWQRSVVFGHPLPAEQEIALHSRRVAAVFLKGAATP